MKRKIILFLTAAALLFFSSDAMSQELPKFPQDPKISTGVLPDGITYYIVSNSTMKGIADFALVQKAGHADEDSLSAGKALSIARSSLASLPKFGSRTPENFLVSYGMSSRKGMLVDVRDDATVYRFEKMPLAYGDAAVDSTLLMIFDIIEGTPYKEDDFFRKHYPTSSSAIIVSGDVDKDAVLTKMKLLSLMVPRRESGQSIRRDYRWIPADTASCSVRRDTTKGYSVVSVSYSSPRIPEKYMDSVLPAVNERLGDILGTVLEKRLYEELRDRDIPVGRIGYRYVKSSERSGDEKYELSVYTGERYVEQVMDAIGSVYSYIDHKGIDVGEYTGAKDEYLIDVYDEAKRPRLSNRRILDKCISSFLYGSDLSVPVDRFNFFMTAGMSDSMQTGFFNRFASALLDSAKNLSIDCMTPSDSISGGRLLSVFGSAWTKEYDSGMSRPYLSVCGDLFPDGDKVKLKVDAERREPVSGGVIWVFSNGMRVVYKRLPTDGIFYYNMLLRGGYSAMAGIRRGEGAFLSDVLETYDIAGIGSDDFHYMMNAKGMTMSSSVTASDIKIFGKVPRPSLSLMIRSLQAVANERTVNEESYEYMRKCMEVSLAVRKGSVADRMAAIDSLMCPSYVYSSEMSMENLSADLPERAQVFFESQFSKMNDGVLIIVGDLEETAMRKFLQRELGGFRTQPVPRPNPRPAYQPIAGWSTYIKDGDSPSVDVVMSTPMIFTMENYMAARVAALAIRDAVAKALGGTTTYFRVLNDAVVYPQERFSVAVSVYGAAPEGFPAGARQIGSLDALYIVRSAIYRLSKSPGGMKDLEVYKSLLKDELVSRQNDPQHIIDMVSMRFSAGKDLNTKYAEKISSVTERQVLDIISALDGGSKIEYVITNRK